MPLTSSLFGLYFIICLKTKHSKARDVHSSTWEIPQVFNYFATIRGICQIIISNRKIQVVIELKIDTKQSSRTAIRTILKRPGSTVVSGARFKSEVRQVDSEQSLERIL